MFLFHCGQVVRMKGRLFLNADGLHRSKKLLFAVHQVAGVVSGQFEPVAMGDGVSGTGLNAVAAEDAAVVIDVVNLGVTLSAADPILRGVLGSLNVNAV